MNKTINDITIEDVSQAAQENSEKYIDHVRKAARQAFIEGVMWAQKVHQERRIS
jgi:hypothetical protein